MRTMQFIAPKAEPTERLLIDKESALYLLKTIDIEKKYPGLLEALSRSKSSDICIGLAWHPSTPDHIRTMLKNVKDVNVHRAAHEAAELKERYGIIALRELFLNRHKDIVANQNAKAESNSALLRCAV